MACCELEQKNDAHLERLRSEGTAALHEVVAQLLIDNKEELEHMARRYTAECRKHRFDELKGAAWIGIFNAAKAIVEDNPPVKSFTAYLKTAADHEMQAHLHDLITPRTVSAATIRRRREKPDKIAQQRAESGAFRTCSECETRTKDYYPRPRCKLAIRCKECHERWVRQKPVKITSVLIGSELTSKRGDGRSDIFIDKIGRHANDWAGIETNNSPTDRWGIVETILTHCCTNETEREVIQLAAAGKADEIVDGKLKKVGTPYKRSEICRRLNLTRYRVNKIFADVIERATQLGIWSGVSADEPVKALVETNKLSEMFKESISEISVLSV